MSKTVSTRLQNDIYEKLVTQCKQKGITVNEFLDDAITHELERETEVLQDRPDEPESPKILSNLNVELGKVYDEDGNVVGTIRKRCFTFVMKC